MDDFLPRFTLEATWSPSHVAQLGNTLSPSDLQDAPSITLTQASSPPSSRAPALDGCIFHANTTYALVLTDPDAPSRSDPKWAEFCHWIAAGVPSSSSSETGCARLELASLKDVVSYRPPGPPPKTGKHRYVFLAFAPANGTTAPLDLTKPEERKRWGSDKEETYGAREWASENGLIPIGRNPRRGEGRGGIVDTAGLLILRRSKFHLCPEQKAVRRLY